MYFDFAQYKQRGQTLIYILIGILILIGVSGGAYYLGRQTTPKPQAQKPIITSTQQPTPSPVDETTNWKTYTNENLGFQIKYPQKLKPSNEDWVYQEYKSMDGGIVGVQFGTSYDQPGGGYWGVAVYNTGDIDSVIKQEGSQFKDRKETRQDVEVDGRKGVLAIITTDDFKDWLDKGVYVKNRGKVYTIGTSTPESEFDDFYKSFKFLE